MPEASSSVTEICDKLFLQPAMSQSDLPLGRGADGMCPGKDKNSLNVQESKS